MSPSWPKGIEVKHINLVGVAALSSALVFSTAAAGQGPAQTLESLKRKYPGMSEIHIKKCDKNGDGLYERGELDCVSSMYRAIYTSD
jgi:hypothetical protein